MTQVFFGGMALGWMAGCWFGAAFNKHAIARRRARRRRNR